jgi:DNA replication protein DnaC
MNWICPCGEDAGSKTGPSGRPECDGCREYREEQMRSRLKERAIRAELPAALCGLELSACAPGPSLDAARDWALGDLPGLCLTGPAGVGKTRLAAAACWARLQEAPVRWVSAARLMAQLRSGFNTEAKAKADAILVGAGAVVLDDIDKASPTDFGREVMFNTIDARIEEGRRLLITTNKSMEELGDQLGDPIKSRVAGYCRVVRMQGRDRRLDS